MHDNSYTTTHFCLCPMAKCVNCRKLVFFTNKKIECFCKKKYDYYFWLGGAGLLGPWGARKSTPLTPHSKISVSDSLAGSKLGWIDNSTCHILFLIVHKTQSHSICEWIRVHLFCKVNLVTHSNSSGSSLQTFTLVPYNKMTQLT